MNHVLIGKGTVIDIDTDHDAYVVRFDTLPTPRTISFRVRMTKEGTE